MSQKITYECDHCHGAFAAPTALKLYGGKDVCARCYGNFVLAEDEVMAQIESGKRHAQVAEDFRKVKDDISKVEAILAEKLIELNDLSAKVEAKKNET